MRITTALVTRGIVTQLSSSSARLVEAQGRVSSGLRVATMSDDPVAGSVIMQASSSLRAITQYRRNVQSLGAGLDAEETALGQLTDVLTRVKEIGVGQVGSPANADSRAVAADEVKQLLGMAVQLGNTRAGDTFVFGGASSADLPPFDAEQTTQPPLYVAIPAGDTAPRLPQGTRAEEIAAGQTMPGTHDGDSVFVRTGLLQSLHDLYVGLSTNDTAAIQDAMPRVDAAFTQLQGLAGDVGARRNQLDMVGASLDAFETSLVAQKSDLSEVDVEQAYTEMISRQTAYQAAMLASSKVMGLSLTDYLR